MESRETDQKVRLAAFEWLSHQVRLYGDVLPREVLAEGFQFEGIRVPLVGPQGIFKPRILPEIPLSITTTIRGPYNDGITAAGLIRYAYRGTDPAHRENAGLRQAMKEKIPLVYFKGIVPGKYLAIWPVFIVGDDMPGLTFTVDPGDAKHAGSELKKEIGNYAVAEGDMEIKRKYAVSLYRHRLHQETFRARVLRAYREQCALCRLRHEKLLDAAHIIPDTDPEGEPIVSNGLALCKLHHSAFDRYFLAIRPDYIVEVRREILEEEDGPMLIHGLKGMHGRPILLPGRRSQHPDPGRLEKRYEEFLASVR